MYSLNRATLIGGLVRDVEIRSTSTGQQVANFTIATSQSWKDANGQKQERTEYTPCVAWGKLADILGQYAAKGSKLYVEGRLQTREWQAQDGTKRQRTEVVVESVILLSKREGQAAAMPKGQAHDQSDRATASDITVEDIDVSQIPF